MDDLYERLLAEVDQPYEIWAPADASIALVNRRRALAAVLELHKPRELSPGSDEWECVGCRVKGVAFVWFAKCPTVRAIAEQLGVHP